ncbi:hypothetical protein EEN62_24415 [Salmonella enterica]|nr:hypothetical protein [Salmonella enterica subsp. diarizonae serovar 17:z10:e,n,x,z15]ECV0014700.1 hypothetical protein [Salmonella enterica]MHJ03056.1 hypothetical protein [Salmonella enterica]
MFSALRVLCQLSKSWVSVNCTACKVYPGFGGNWLRFALAGFGVLKCASIRKMQKSPKQGLYNVIVRNGDISCYPLSWMTLIF